QFQLLHRCLHQWEPGLHTTFPPTACHPATAALVIHGTSLRRLRGLQPQSPEIPFGFAEDSMAAQTELREHPIQRGLLELLLSRSLFANTRESGRRGTGTSPFTDHMFISGD